MQDLCNRVLDLLNGSDTGETFQKFIGELPDSLRPLREAINDHSRLHKYIFPDLGFWLYVADDWIFTVHFKLIPANLEDGLRTEVYTGALPFGVSITDHRKNVHEKLGLPSVDAHDRFVCDSYDTEGWHLTFFYELPSEKLIEARVMKSR
jgi:hypothetical protein